MPRLWHRLLLPIESVEQESDSIDIVCSQSKKAASYHTTLGLLVAAALLTILGPLLFAQGSPIVTAVDPSSGKVDDTVTVAGENLGKGTVSAVFLSDDKTDYKATGNTEATYKMSANDDPVSLSFKGMRLLKRQSNGSWKFAVVGLK